MKKEKQRSIRTASIVALLLATIGSAKADSSKKDSDDFLSSILKTFVVEERYDKADADDFWLELARIEELGSQLEDLEASNKKRFDEVFQGAVDFIQRAGSPEEIITQIESRRDRMVDRIINEYSPNSGQDDALDAQMRDNYDPFVNSMAEYFARAALQMGGGSGPMLRDRLSPDPFLMQGRLTDEEKESAAWAAKQIIDARKQRVANLGREYQAVMRKAIDATDAEERGRLKAEADSIEREQKAEQKRVNEEEAALKVAMKANLEALKKPLDDTTEMPVPGSIDPGYPGAGILIKLTTALDVTLEERLSPMYGLINPGPDNDNHRIEDIPDRERRGDSLDPYINPGSDNYDEPTNVPDSFAPLPHIDGFGGAIDPLGPKGSIGSEDADSGKQSDQKSSTLFGD